MNIDTLVLFLISRVCPITFWMITWMKNMNNFQIAKV